MLLKILTPIKQQYPINDKFLLSARHCISYFISCICPHYPHEFGTLSMSILCMRKMVQKQIKLICSNHILDFYLYCLIYLQTSQTFHILNKWFSNEGIFAPYFRECLPKSGVISFIKLQLSVLKGEGKCAANISPSGQRLQKFLNILQ